MRKFLFGLVGVSMLLFGTCIQDAALKLGTVAQLGVGPNITGCTLHTRYEMGTVYLPYCGVQ